MKFSIYKLPTLPSGQPLRCGVLRNVPPGAFLNGARAALQAEIDAGGVQSPGDYAVVAAGFEDGSSLLFQFKVAPLGIV